MTVLRSERSSLRFESLLLWLASVVSFGEILGLRRMLRFWNTDMIDYTAWYAFIVQHGRWRSLHGLFSSYSPPYIYVLSLASNLEGWLRPILIIKLATLPFVFLSAGLFWAIARQAGCSPRRCWIAAWVLVIAPEVVANSIVWGQADIMETTFLLMFAWLALLRRPGWAMLAAGVALSFKLQAIFAGPAVLALFLTGELPWVSLAALPAGYLLAMLPAELAGRPLLGLVGAYSGQAGVPERVAMGAVNPYEFLLGWTGRLRWGPRVWWTEHVGLAVAALLAFALVLYLHRHYPLRTPRRLLTALGLSSLLVPFSLPKMHDRYLYIGDVFALLLGVIEPRFFLPAILLQIVAVLAYSTFLIGFSPRPWWYALPVALVVWAMYAMLRELGRETADT